MCKMEWNMMEYSCVGLDYAMHVTSYPFSFIYCMSYLRCAIVPFFNTLKTHEQMAQKLSP
jgi:hypothetical protein